MSRAQRLIDNIDEEKLPPATVSVTISGTSDSVKKAIQRLSKGKALAKAAKAERAEHADEPESRRDVKGHLIDPARDGEMAAKRDYNAEKAKRAKKSGDE